MLQQHQRRKTCAGFGLPAVTLGLDLRMAVPVAGAKSTARTGWKEKPHVIRSSRSSGNPCKKTGVHESR